MTAGGGRNQNTAEKGWIVRETAMLEAGGCVDGTERPTIPQLAEKLRAGLDEVEATLNRTLGTIEGPAGDVCRGDEPNPCCLIEDLVALAVQAERISALAHRLDSNFNR